MVETFGILREHRVQILTVGQYLRPTEQHLPVVRYWHPDEFDGARATRPTSSASSRSPRARWSAAPTTPTRAPARSPSGLAARPSSAPPARLWLDDLVLALVVYCEWTVSLKPAAQPGFFGAFA